MKALLALTAGMAAAAGLFSGCAHSTSGEVYSRNQTRVAQDVSVGTVESVKPVKIEGTRSGVGAAAGGVAGGVAGAQVGAGKGQILAGLGGAAVGAVAGVVGEELITRETGQQIVVRMPDGHLIAVVQKADVTFNPGDRVRILKAGGTTRVQHEP